MNGQLTAEEEIMRDPKRAREFVKSLRLELVERQDLWTFESVAVLFVTGGGFKGIADAHNKAMKQGRE